MAKRSKDIFGRGKSIHDQVGKEQKQAMYSLRNSNKIKMSRAKKLGNSETQKRPREDGTRLTLSIMLKRLGSMLEASVSPVVI